jgi:hypothetical protein
MDAHASTEITDARIEGGFKMLPFIKLGVGAVCLLAAWGLGTGKNDGMRDFWFSYLTAFVYFLAIALGGLFFVLLQHLVSAKWSITVRRIAECVANSIWVMGILAIPIVVAVYNGSDALYPWVNPETVKESPLLQHKAGWLNPGFFAIRVVLYFTIWTLLSQYLYRTSLAQDESGDPAISIKQRRMSAPSMIVFALSLTFASFDFIMSLTPTWYSTIFGIYYFASCAMSFMATLGLLCMFVQKSGGVKSAITTEHYHDIGKFLFTFIFFWGYISFSQYMLMWYGNIPEETEFFLLRKEGEWLNVSVLIIFGHFLVPFVGMLSRNVKRNRSLLAFWSVWMLVMHFVQMFWLVKHNYDPHHVTFGLLDILCLVGIGGLFMGNVLRVLGSGTLTPIKEPRFEASLAFHNM